MGFDLWEWFFPDILHIASGVRLILTFTLIFIFFNKDLIFKNGFHRIYLAHLASELRLTFTFTFIFDLNFSIVWALVSFSVIVFTFTLFVLKKDLIWKNGSFRISCTSRLGWGWLWAPKLILFVWVFHRTFRSHRKVGTVGNGSRKNQSKFNFDVLIYSS